MDYYLNIDICGKMRFGFHLSIGRGFEHAVRAAKALECQTIQIFAQNPRGWAIKAFNNDDVNAFKQLIDDFDISPVSVHMPYLPNLASGDDNLYRRSISTFCDNLRRAKALGARYLVVHPGNSGSLSQEEAIDRLCAALNQTFTTVNNDVMVLLENTAGQGTEIGCTFDQLKRIMKAVTVKKRLGICLDTAHAFAAGYDLSTKQGLENTLEEFDRIIGMRRLRLFHLNDSKTPLGSHVDRHTHIGHGDIGREGFRRIINHHELSGIPGVMETPKKSDDDDTMNMKTLKKLVDRTRKK